jgi:hypothetical protein
MAGAEVRGAGYLECHTLVSADTGEAFKVSGAVSVMMMRILKQQEDLKEQRFYMSTGKLSVRRKRLLDSLLSKLWITLNPTS